MRVLLNRSDRYYTYAEPLDSYCAHLENASRPTVARKLLSEQFGASKSVIKRFAPMMCAHLTQGLSFHRTSRTAPHAVRPLLQYYSYLNLAVACVAAYRPLNHEQYRRHGLSDQSPHIRRLSLNSVVLKTSQGAVPIFNQIVSLSDIGSRKFTLRELVSACGFFAAELESAFRVKQNIIKVTPQLQIRGENGHLRPGLTFHTERGEYQGDRLLRAHPALRKVCEWKRVGTGLHGKSIHEYQEGSAAYDSFVTSYLEKAVNLGGYPGSDHYIWPLASKGQILPTLTAVIMMMYFASSLARYRPELTARLAPNKLGLLFDVLTHEADYVVIPAIRNLIHREQTCIRRHS